MYTGFLIGTLVGILGSQIFEIWHQWYTWHTYKDNILWDSDGE